MLFLLAVVRILQVYIYICNILTSIYKKYWHFAACIKDRKWKLDKILELDHGNWNHDYGVGALGWELRKWRLTHIFLFWTSGSSSACKATK